MSTTPQSGSSIATPNITPAQILSIIVAALGLVVAFGVNVSHAQQEAIIQFVTVLIPSIIAGDAVIRYGRSRALAPVVKAEPDSSVTKVTL